MGAYIFHRLLLLPAVIFAPQITRFQGIFQSKVGDFIKISLLRMG